MQEKIKNKLFNSFVKIAAAAFVLLLFALNINTGEILVSVQRIIRAQDFEVNKAFSENCSGNWQNPQFAAGQPDIGEHGIADNFYQANSSISDQDQGELIVESFKTDSIDFLEDPEINIEYQGHDGYDGQSRNAESVPQTADSASSTDQDRDHQNGANAIVGYLSDFYSKINQASAREETAGRRERIISAKLSISLAIKKKKSAANFLPGSSVLPEGAGGIKDSSDSGEEIGDMQSWNSAKTGVFSAESGPAAEDDEPILSQANSQKPGGELEGRNMPDAETYPADSPAATGGLDEKIPVAGINEGIPSDHNIAKPQPEKSIGEPEKSADNDQASGDIVAGLIEESRRLINEAVRHAEEIFKNLGNAIRAENAGAQEDPDSSSDLLVIWYSLKDGFWQKLETLPAEEFSNYANGGYLKIDLPEIQSASQVKDLKIKFERMADDEGHEIYLDSAWVEVETEKNHEAPAGDDASEYGRFINSFEFNSGKNSFEAGKEPELAFKYRKIKRGILKSLTEFLRLADYWEKVKISVEIFDRKGNKLELCAKVDYENNGEFTIRIPGPKRSLAPGKYRLKIKVVDQTDSHPETIEYEHGFSWGVLAFNPNKAIYNKDDTAYLQMAVLDGSGNTVCDSGLALEITRPDGKLDILTSSDGEIIRNPDCAANNVIAEPDYYAHYKADQIGIYSIRMISNYGGEEREISDSFEVRESAPFEVERAGPTRIYPKADYEMQITIKANQDFKGSISEYVPSGFKIVDENSKIKNQNALASSALAPTPASIRRRQGERDRPATSRSGKLQFKIQNLDSSTQLLNWSYVEIAKGDELEISYTFDAPDISPEFYLLGPLEIGSFSETRKWQIASDATKTRSKTVMFLAGIFSGDGTTGQNSDTNQIFPEFNYNLAEKDVDIKNAYLIFEAQFESYANNAGSYTGYSLAFDSCQEPCGADAVAGAGRATRTDSTVLAYDESESNKVRLLLDVTDEAQLAAYAGSGASMGGQVGYSINRGAAINSISYAKSILVLTYTYDSLNSATTTNTVIYPLESTYAGDSGTRGSVQADDCSLDINCPSFNYKMEIPEIDSKISQWFELSIANEGYRVTQDIAIDVNIGISAPNSSTYVHETALRDQANAMNIPFTGVANYTENTTQSLEVRAQSGGAPTYYLMGGEAFETYTASSAAPIKTRTVSFPIGVVNNGATAATTSASVEVYFPENGNATGTVKVKKAWFRISHNNSYDNAGADYISDIETKVAGNATSSIKRYAYNPADEVTNPAFNIYHVLPADDYSELENANAQASKQVLINTRNSDAAYPGGTSAELMITYTYASEAAGYLATSRLYAGQSLVNGNATSTTTPTANLVAPESIGKTMRAAMLHASYLMSDNDASVPNRTDTAIDANVSTGNPVCANNYRSGNEAFNTYLELYKNVTGQLNTANGQSFNACYSISNPGDASAGAKMNGQLIYTYQWDDTAPTGTINSALAINDGSGVVEASFTANDLDSDDLRAKIEYATGTLCDFSFAGKATLSTADASTTADYGDPKVDNANAYQIGNSSGWITTASGTNAVNFSWNSKTDLPQGDDTYCLRLTLSDQGYDQLVPATSTVIIDNRAPTAPGQLAATSTTATTTRLIFSATSTESHFAEYRIYYKEHDGSLVGESDSLFSSSSDPNLGNILFNGATSTIVAGLSAGTTYSFNIFAYDSYGQKSSSTQIQLTTNNYPIAAINSVSQKTDGSGVVDISIEVDDLDDQNDLRAKVEYAAGAACDFSSPLKPTIDENDASTIADFGDPKVENDNDYQIGNLSGYIHTQPGSNTVNFDWLSKTDLPDSSGVYCVRVTVNDGLDCQLSSATSTLLLDNVDPTAPGQLTEDMLTQNSIRLYFGATTTESNFSQYRIFYTPGFGPVGENHAEHIDGNLNYIDYYAAASTTIGPLPSNTYYTINIWAYDMAGNKASSAPITLKTEATISNESLAFTNPPAYNVAIGNDSFEANFRAVVSETNGWLNIASATLRLADQADSSSLFDDLAFTWYRDTDSFAETGLDALKAARISPNSTSTCSSNICTLDFKIIFNKDFASSSLDYDAQLQSFNNADIFDLNAYDDFYQVRVVNVRQVHYRWRNDDGGE